MEIKSAWLSKINWTVAVSFIASMAALFGFDVPAETQTHIILVINAITGLAIWIMRTWFTYTVTPSAVQLNEPKGP